MNIVAQPMTISRSSYPDQRRACLVVQVDGEKLSISHEFSLQVPLDKVEEHMQRRILEEIGRKLFDSERK